MSIDPASLVVIGKITAVYGVKGWVKVHSYTEPMENFFGYRDCYINQGGQYTNLELDAVKRHGKGLIAHIKGVDDRDQAGNYTQALILVPVEALPELEQDEFYWHQLQGLEVITTAAYGEQLLGKVHHLMETGANDVLVVRACQGSIDRQERLIPYLPEQVVKQIDVAAGQISVEWDPEF